MKILIDHLKNISELITSSQIVLKKDSVLEFYHHKGIDYFLETGAVFINIINQEYCKSYGILLKNQKYPNHFHRIKKETFFVLYGELLVTKDDSITKLLPGEMLTIERGENHFFHISKGAVFEEISTTYLLNDSVYQEESIKNTDYSQRKTKITLNKFREMLNNDKSKASFN